MVPIPWVKLWRYKGAIPIILVMCFAFFAIGADAGAEASMAGNESLKEIAENDGAWQTAEVSTVENVTRETPLTRTGAEAIVAPFAATVIPMFRDGVLWGYANPELGVWGLEAANLAMFGTVAGYLYVAYRSLKWVF